MGRKDVELGTRPLTVWPSIWGRYRDARPGWNKGKKTEGKVVMNQGWESTWPDSWRLLTVIGSFPGMFLVNTIVKDTDKEERRIFTHSEEPRMLRKEDMSWLSRLDHFNTHSMELIHFLWRKQKQNYLYGDDFSVFFRSGFVFFTLFLVRLVFQLFYSESMHFMREKKTKIKRKKWWYCFVPTGWLQHTSS